MSATAMFDEAPFNAEQAAEALKRVRQGHAPYEFCGTHSIYPSDPGALDRWATEDPAFAEKLADARKIGADAMVMYCVSIADDKTLKADSKKVMIDVRMKLAAMWHPDKYGPKTGDIPTGIQAHLHIPYNEVPTDKKAEIEKFFGFI